MSAPRRGLLGFLKDTLVGGLFVLIPLAVLLFIVAQIAIWTYAAIKPAVKLLPIEGAGSIAIIVLIAIGALVALCFLLGLLARTRLAKWLVKSIETAILSNLPGYTLMKSMGEGMAGVEGADKREAVLAKIHDTTQIGFVMDRLADGRSAVFIPGVPNPWSGQLHLLSPVQIEPLQSSIRASLECLQKLGVDAAEVITPTTESGAGQ